MRTVDIEPTAYPPLLVNIADTQIIERYTLSPVEQNVVGNYRGDKLSLAVRLKVFEHLRSYNFQLALVPQKVVDYLASQLGVAGQELSENRGQRYEQIQICRKFTGFTSFSDAQASKLVAWLIKRAFKQFHLIDLINDAIFHLQEILVELPTFGRLARFCAHALSVADTKQKELLLTYLW